MRSMENLHLQMVNEHVIPDATLMKILDTVHDVMEAGE